VRRRRKRAKKLIKKCFFIHFENEKKEFEPKKNKHSEGNTFFSLPNAIRSEQKEIE
jgi:hypothetical protein